MDSMYDENAGAKASVTLCLSAKIVELNLEIGREVDAFYAIYQVGLLSSIEDIPESIVSKMRTVDALLISLGRSPAYLDCLMLARPHQYQ